jgi:fructose-bisphosphate aldolase class I
MNQQILRDTIQQLFEDGKGLLAMDESTGTCNKRFAAVGIPQTVEMRRRYRELIITTPNLQESIGGAILYDETIRLQSKDGIPLIDILIQSGIIPGIKVDMGTQEMSNFPNEKITEGLDGLRERLVEYKKMGARFAKWRAVITIGNNIPTKACIQANMQDLARYASLCQEADIVPIVEPEVLMDGNHTIQKCYEVTENVLKVLFDQLNEFKVDLEGIILKPNMIIAGKDCNAQNSIEEVAEATVNSLLASVPSTVPAIAFLSGGQTPEEADAHLNAINKNFKDQLPWIVTFSFARAIQQPVLEIWKGETKNIEEAQKMLFKRAKYSVDARRGVYSTEIE